MPAHNRLTLSASHPPKPSIRKKRVWQGWNTFLRPVCRWRGARWARRTLATVPAAVRIAFVVATILAVVSLANAVYQVVRKPTELLFFVGGALDKVPSETWQQYGPLFRKYSTDTITPELLAALAQIESTGNPVARTYWRWRLTWNPFGVYKPASSVVGLYQMTDAAYAEASRYCVRRHAVVDADCRFNNRLQWPPLARCGISSSHDRKPAIFVVRPAITENPPYWRVFLRRTAESRLCP
jgi:hypothetical protein